MKRGESHITLFSRQYSPEMTLNLVAYLERDIHRVVHLHLRPKIPEEKDS